MVTGAVSLASAGQNQQPGDGASIAPSISADGRYVAFESAADNLVPGDANASHDIFVMDLRSGLVRLASARSDGVQADRGGFAPAISADGGMVVFMSPATNLVAGASGGSLTQIYRKDLSGGGVSLVSASAAGQPGDKDSVDHAAYGPAISADGRYAAFVSSADNLVAGDTNGVVDVFLKDVQTGTVSRISTDSSGRQTSGSVSRPALPAGERFVVFSSTAPELTGSNNGTNEIFVKNVATGHTQLLSHDFAGVAGDADSRDAAISADGHTVTFVSQAGNLVAGDANGAADVFQAPATLAYYWSWYDQKSPHTGDWVLAANPASASRDAYFDLLIAGQPQNFTPLAADSCPAPRSGCIPGEAPPGETAVASVPGIMGGPVEAGSLDLGQAIMSQRSLWGSSLEEVPATAQAGLSSQYYWPWYDQKSPGFSDWVLVANPSTTETVHAVVSFTNAADGSAVSAAYDIAPGQDWTPQFDQKMGGPVQVKAYLKGGAWPADARNVIASQRVLSGGGAAFNEVAGIPSASLVSDYYWPWYDQKSPGFSDWVLVANPSASQDMYYEIDLAGHKVADDQSGYGQVPPGTIAPGRDITPQFDTLKNGPLEVKTYADAAHSVPLASICSQRVLAGPSFEEVPAYATASLAGDYLWTWYDSKSAGASNWVLIANPSASRDVYYQLSVAGQTLPRDKPGDSPNNPGFIAPSGNVTPIFSGLMGGPVEVRTCSQPFTTGGSCPGATPPVVASQRVLWNGYFNEVLGTVTG